MCAAVVCSQAVCATSFDFGHAAGVAVAVAVAVAAAVAAAVAVADIARSARERDLCVFVETVSTVVRCTRVYSLFVTL